MTSTKRVVVGFLALQPVLALVASKVYREKHRPDLPQSRTLSLKGKRVLVTGGSSGIGKATVARLKDLGATLVLGGRNNRGLRNEFYLGEGGKAGKDGRKDGRKDDSNRRSGATTWVMIPASLKISPLPCVAGLNKNPINCVSLFYSLS